MAPNPALAFAESGMDNFIDAFEAACTATIFQVTPEAIESASIKTKRSIVQKASYAIADQAGKNKQDRATRRRDAKDLLASMTDDQIAELVASLLSEATKLRERRRHEAESAARFKRDTIIAGIAAFIVAVALLYLGKE